MKVRIDDSKVTLIDNSGNQLAMRHKAALLRDPVEIETPDAITDYLTNIYGYVVEPTDSLVGALVLAREIMVTRRDTVPEEVIEAWKWVSDVVDGAICKSYGVPPIYLIVYTHPVFNNIDARVHRVSIVFDGWSYYWCTIHRVAIHRWLDSIGIEARPIGRSHTEKEVQKDTGVEDRFIDLEEGDCIEKRYWR